MHSQAKQLRRLSISKAAVDILPLSISVIPWGILCGAIAIEAGFSPVQAQLMSLIVFAGAAQLSSCTLIGVGTPLFPLMGSTFVITSQHLLYGFTFRKDVINLPLKWRAALAFFLTDEMFAVSVQERERTSTFCRYYALSAGIVFYLFWNASTLLGLIAGNYIKNIESLGLDFAIAAIFIAMTIDNIKKLPMLAATITSAVIAVIAKKYAPDMYIILSACAGMLTGYFLSEKEEQ